MSFVDNERPPYVVFEQRAVEDRAATLANGHYTTKDVDFAIITRPGSRDSLDKEALVWLKELGEKARNGSAPLAWHTAFEAAYAAWKKGLELPLNGTPIKGWPVLSPAAQENLIRAGFLTLEDLAATSDNQLSNIGTGALSYKLKAQAWLEEAKSKGASSEKIADLVQKVADLTSLVQQLVDENKRLKALIPDPAKTPAKA
jgi:hypothetical protein